MKAVKHKNNIYNYDYYEYSYLNTRFIIGSVFLIILIIFAVIFALVDSYTADLIVKGAIDD